MRTISITFIVLGLCSLAACGNRGTKHAVPVKNASQQESIPPMEDVKGPDEPTYTPKATYTSIEQMSSLLPDGDFKLGTLNEMFLEDCYYTGETTTPFLASFAERWNKFTFLRRFVNAEEIFLRENSNLGDSLTTETVRGRMPMLPDEFSLAFTSKNNQAKAKRLVHLLSTIDYVPAQCDILVRTSQALVETPYETQEMIEKEAFHKVEDGFWELYDKSKYVSDIEQIQHVRVKQKLGSEAINKQLAMLKTRYVKARNFDTRCILAIELACCGQEDGVDYLGELIEAVQYSPYLVEVWVQWRLRAQAEVFGCSTYSEIPDNLYDQVRLTVAEQYLKHLSNNPDDNLAKYLLWQLMNIENLHRLDHYYGNESVFVNTVLKEEYFLPAELKENSQSEDWL